MAESAARLAVRVLKVLVDAQGRKPTREERKALGLQYGRFAPYGYKWSRRWKDGMRRLVPHPRERLVMQRIVDWWQAGYSWRQISDHLAKIGERTKNGTKWSWIRCQRAYRAELPLRQEEARAPGQATDPDQARADPDRPGPCATPVTFGSRSLATGRPSAWPCRASALPISQLGGLPLPRPCRSPCSETCSAPCRCRCPAAPRAAMPPTAE
jgi:hypothetical protein